MSPGLASFLVAALMSFSVLSACLGTGALLLGARRAGMAPGSVAAPIAVTWLALIAYVVAARSGVFLWGYGSPLSALVVAYFGGGAAVMGWSLGAPTLARVVATFGLPSLIGIQAFRVIGGTLLLLHHQRLLPDYFALTVGWGDVTAGVTAPVVALVARARVRGWWTLCALWTAYATGDLFHSAIAATLSSDTPLRLLPLLPAVLGEFPMILLIVYLVPFALCFCLATALKLRQEARSLSSA